MADETPRPERSRPVDNDLGADHLVHAKGISVDVARQRLAAQRRAPRVHDAAKALLGDRFGEVRIDEDGYVLLTIIDMTPADVEAIGRIAGATGIAEWVRTRRADPAALQAWEEVRHELIRLRDTRRGVLMGYPMPDPGYRHPPFNIRLAAYATDVAAALHERFGPFVALHVGALKYPPSPDQPPPHASHDEMPTIDPAEIHVELDGPLRISIGRTITHGLNVRNTGDAELTVSTNGHLTADVIDPASHRVVGGYTGMQILPLVLFSIPPNTTVRIPLLIGTASFDRELGYAIPPGTWALRCTLGLTDGRGLNTPPLPLTITQ